MTAKESAISDVLPSYGITGDMESLGGFDVAINYCGPVDAGQVALVLPGRFDTKDYVHVQDFQYELGNSGFLTLAFDPPGTWYSSGQFHKSNDKVVNMPIEHAAHYNPSTYSISNYVAVTKLLISRYRDRKLALVGHSRGGGVALESAHWARMEQAATIIGVVAINSNIEPSRPAQGRKMYTRSDPLHGYDDIRPDQATLYNFLVPDSFYQDAAKHNVMETIQDCSFPKLFFAGDQDDLAPLSEILLAFGKAAEPKELHIIPGSEHNIRRSKDATTKIIKIARNFLLSNITHQK